jgi:hypothetical protein
MRPLEIVYWLRLAFGFIAALVSLIFAIAVYGTPLPTGSQTSIFFNSISLAIIVYLLSYYVLKPRFQDKVAKVSKLLTTGIGVYFLTWIVFYVLLYTAFSGA